MAQPRDLRDEYRRSALDESALPSSPVAQFARWFDEAVNAGLRDPNAMTVATATASGAPSARVMLLKGFDEFGFVFFTNFSSRKSEELAGNPRAALVFFWHELERQVRIEGKVEKISRAENEAYFQSRPRASQIGAWASHQSRPIPTRKALEEHEKDILARFGDGAIPCPDFWGGYRVIPAMLEFWQGRPGRLHDRLVYRRQGNTWTISRLEP